MSVETQTQHVLACFPTTWGGDTAYTPSGGLYTIATGVGTAHDSVDSLISYAKLQTRIASATDSNLDAIAADMLGPGSNRSLTIQGNNLILESDPAYSQRIRNTLIAEQVTVKGMTALLNTWVNTYYVVDYVLNVRILGLSAEGGLDTWGGLDGRPVTTPPIPTITVFDSQSDPVRAQRVGLTASQFCVLATYGGIKKDGFILGHAHVGRGDHLVSTTLRGIAPLSPAFDAYVRKIKAVGTVPIYFDNRG